MAAADANARNFNGLNGSFAEYEVGPSELIFVGLEIENTQ